MVGTPQSMEVVRAGEGASGADYMTTCSHLSTARLGIFGMPRPAGAGGRLTALMIALAPYWGIHLQASNQMDLASWQKLAGDSHADPATGSGTGAPPLQYSYPSSPWGTTRAI